jgi:hypothetical protein
LPFSEVPSTFPFLFILPSSLEESPRERWSSSNLDNVLSKP